MEGTAVSITKKEVETKLLTFLLELLSNEGFILKKKDKRIVRKTKTGFEDFGFHVLNYWPYCTEINSAGFSIRFDAVEEVIVPIEVRNGLRASMEFAKTSITVANSCKFNIKIFNEKDLDDFIRAHIDKIKEDGLSFFSKHNDISDVNVYYKDMILGDKEGIYNTITPIMTSLTLMGLCKDKDFDEMKIKYRQLLKPLHGMEKETFAAYNDLVETLREIV